MNIVKAKYDLKDKSQAIRMIIEEYEKTMLEPGLRPEFVEKVNEARKGTFSSYESVDDLDDDIRK
ncbi:MAG: DUF2683 family protein [Candidatus Woesearchaeota archaeon]